jgi:hypothetical protein
MSIGTAREKGTFTIPVSFTDEDDAAVIPDSITWSLSRTDGSIVNSREDVAVASPAASVNITLSGNDLAILTDSDIDRIFTVKIVYDSDIGDNLPQNDQDTFTIKPLSQVANG